MPGPRHRSEIRALIRLLHRLLSLHPSSVCAVADGNEETAKIDVTDENAAMDAYRVMDEDAAGATKPPQDCTIWVFDRSLGRYRRGFRRNSHP